MELFTMDRKFIKADTIDKFHSVIWTERYYGDSEVELIVPATKEKIQKLQPGTFLGLVGSNEPMILETQDTEEGKLKVNGISLLKWLNNRFIRTSPKHEDRYWYLSGGTAGWSLWAIVYYMCVPGSPFLVPGAPTGIPNPERLAIPGLWLSGFDDSGSHINLAVPFGPVYDALREIATTFQLGMQIILGGASEAGYSLLFRDYKGLDRTSAQTVNPVIRLSPAMDSLTEIKELRSISSFKTQVYSFAPSNPGELATVPGQSALAGGEFTGFDLRAMLVFADDITTDQVNGDANILLQLLNARAADALSDRPYVRVVDGEVVPRNQFQYRVHYNLGDIIEIAGTSEIVSRARITEFIRAQDDAGERSYPTVSIID